MPKDLKSLTPSNKNKFIYHSQSLKKTHCTKIINNYKTTAKILINKPKDHWTENKQHSNWEYFVFIINQITIESVEFQKTQDWKQWNQIQKNQLILEKLINNSINLISHTPEEVKTLNENLTKDCERNSQSGKNSQTKEKFNIY